MAAGPQFNLDHDVTYGSVDVISPLVQRVTCKNPSKFTFKGTGTYLIGNADSVAIVDPGPTEDAHVDALIAAVAGRTVTHLLITHTHGDHSPAAGLLKHHIDAPTYAFGPHPVGRPDPDAAKDEDESGFGFDPIEEDEDDKNNDDEDEGYKSEHAQDWDFVPDVTVAHGDIIEADGFSFEALHTPGHISNHLCFALREENALFSGDHVMGWSTTIIPPPDGNLNSYLASLRLLTPRTESVYYPTHGAPITDPTTLVPALHAHREARTAQILACLADGIDTIKEMVLRMYTHVPAQLYPAAGASVMSHLLALHETGAVTCNDGKGNSTKPGSRTSYVLA